MAAKIQSANGGPPQRAAALYVGHVMHARLRPVAHRFRYGVFNLLIDIDRLAEAGRMSGLFATERAGITSFHSSDHCAAGETLRSRADRLLSAAGLASPANRILILCYPRVFGYVFNPISLWFAYDADDRLTAVIYAVRNTFGQSHSYVCPVRDGQLTAAGLRQSCAKAFHVSPFLGMEGRYDFRALPPGRQVRLRIHETEAGLPVLEAAFSGREQALTSASLALALVRTPFLTLKVTAGIHWQALKLWLKGVQFHTSPPQPPEASFGNPPLLQAKTRGKIDE